MAAEVVQKAWEGLVQASSVDTYIRFPEEAPRRQLAWTLRGSTSGLPLPG